MESSLKWEMKNEREFPDIQEGKRSPDENIERVERVEKIESVEGVHVVVQLLMSASISAHVGIRHGVPR